MTFQTVSFCTVYHNISYSTDLEYQQHVIKTDVTVELHPLNQTVAENQNFTICAQLRQGSLERNVQVGMEAENSSAIRMKHKINYSHVTI